MGVFPLLQLSSKLFLQGSKLFLVLLQGCKLLLDASDGMVRLRSRAASSVHGYPAVRAQRRHQLLQAGDLLQCAVNTGLQQREQRNFFFSSRQQHLRRLGR